MSETQGYIFRYWHYVLGTEREIYVGLSNGMCVNTHKLLSFGGMFAEEQTVHSYKFSLKTNYK